MAIEQFSIDVLFSYRLNNILFDIRMHNYVVIFGLSCHALKNGWKGSSRLSLSSKAALFPSTTR